MTKWHAHVVHMAKHMNMVGGLFLVRGPGPPSKSGADQQWCRSWGCRRTLPKVLLCQKFGQNLKKFGQRSFDIFKRY